MSASGFCYLDEKQHLFPIYAAELTVGIQSWLIQFLLNPEVRCQMLAFAALLLYDLSWVIIVVLILGSPAFFFCFSQFLSPACLLPLSL